MTALVHRAGWLAAAALALFVVAAITGTVVGGPLDPDAPPGETNGVLLPGTPIESVPIKLEKPGFYYLRGNLETTKVGDDGITIAGSDITVDLGGFVLTGLAVDSVGTGIYVSSGTNVTIRNGTIVQFGQGIFAAGVDGGRIEGVSVFGSYGAAISAGNDWTIEDCLALHNRADGITISGGAVRNCQVSQNLGSGITLGGGEGIIEGNLVRGNCDAFTPCGSTGAGINLQGDRATVRGNELGRNGNFDIRAGSTENLVRENSYCTITGGTLVDNHDRVC